MVDVLIRNVSPKVVSALRARAKKNRRSLQAELTIILEQEAQYQSASAWSIVDGIRQDLSGGKHTDSVQLLEQDRAR